MHFDDNVHSLIIILRSIVQRYGSIVIFFQKPHKTTYNNSNYSSETRYLVLDAILV